MLAILAAWKQAQREREKNKSINNNQPSQTTSTQASTSSDTQIVQRSVSSTCLFPSAPPTILQSFIQDNANSPSSAECDTKISHCCSYSHARLKQHNDELDKTISFARATWAAFIILNISQQYLTAPFNSQNKQRSSQSQSTPQTHNLSQDVVNELNHDEAQQSRSATSSSSSSVDNDVKHPHDPCTLIMLYAEQKQKNLELTSKLSESVIELTAKNMEIVSLNQENEEMKIEFDTLDNSSKKQYDMLVKERMKNQQLQEELTQLRAQLAEQQQRVTALSNDLQREHKQLCDARSQLQEFKKKQQINTGSTTNLLASTASSLNKHHRPHTSRRSSHRSHVQSSPSPSPCSSSSAGTTASAACSASAADAVLRHMDNRLQHELNTSKYYKIIAKKCIVAYVSLYLYVRHYTKKMKHEISEWIKRVEEEKQRHDQASSAAAVVMSKSFKSTNMNAALYRLFSPSTFPLLSPSFSLSSSCYHLKSILIQIVCAFSHYSPTVTTISCADNNNNKLHTSLTHSNRITSKPQFNNDETNSTNDSKHETYHDVKSSFESAVTTTSSKTQCLETSTSTSIIDSSTTNSLFAPRVHASSSLSSSAETFSCDSSVDGLKRSRTMSATFRQQLAQQFINQTNGNDAHASSQTSSSGTQSVKVRSTSRTSKLQSSVQHMMINNQPSSNKIETKSSKKSQHC